ncbi:uncharacterized protein [Lolium perenne]|uniref:uncharacterized protein n=1 Tax=Lolium perenne TaxID=4522 RepID=UPI003A99B6A2
MQVLEKYSRSTDQLINPNKCSIYFGQACEENVKAQAKSILQFTAETFETRYLGLPTPKGRMSKGKFQSQGKLTKRVLQIKNHMAQGGKEVFIKAVAQSLSTYVMGVYKLPLGLCDDLTKIIRDFWWGSEKGKRKMDWVAWEIMLKPKIKGGMGFKDMRIFNQALLVRQAWRLLQNPVNLFVPRYYVLDITQMATFIDTVFSGNASSTWHAIEYGLELLKKGVIWRIGNGTDVRIWRDPWIPRNDYYKTISPKRRCRLKWVSELLNNDGSWNTNLPQIYFQPMDISEIMKIKTSRRNDVDFVAWGPDEKGILSLKERICVRYGTPRNRDGQGSNKQQTR